MGLQDQQPAYPVENERAGGDRDGREAEGIQGGLVRPETALGGHGLSRYGAHADHQWLDHDSHRLSEVDIPASARFAMMMRWWTMNSASNCK